MIGLMLPRRLENMIRVFSYNNIMRAISILILALVAVTLQGYDNGQVNF